tara:strand:+ start:1459 stop:2100 length:642 start_codon:yes stop_codon:yes gene_type:complete
MLVKVLRYLLLVRFKIDIVEEIFRRIGFMDRSKLGRLISAAAFLITIQGCGGPIKQEFPVLTKDGQVFSDVELEKQAKEEGKIFGSDGIDLFNLGGNKRKAAEGSGIGVNSYLWRASLDTISFLPLASADPFGGVIITDWYSPPEAPNERYKLSVYILGRQLRADGIRVAVHRQNLKATAWQTGVVSRDTALNLENKILARARQLRIASSKVK